MARRGSSNCRTSGKVYIDGDIATVQENEPQPLWCYTWFTYSHWFHQQTRRTPKRECLFRLRFAQSRAAHLDLAATLAVFASRSV